MGGGIGFAEYQKEEKNVKTKKHIPLILAGVICAILSFSFTIIPTGYTGVRIVFGKKWLRLITLFEEIEFVCGSIMSAQIIVIIVKLENKIVQNNTKLQCFH